MTRYHITFLVIFFILFLLPTAPSDAASSQTSQQSKSLACKLLGVCKEPPRTRVPSKVQILANR